MTRKPPAGPGARRSNPRSAAGRNDAVLGEVLLGGEGLGRLAAPRAARGAAARAASSSSPAPVAAEVTSTGTSSPSRSRPRAPPRRERLLGGHEVGLRQREQARQRSQARVVRGELALDRREVRLRVGAVERREVEDVDEQPRALDVREEVVAEPRARRSRPRSGRGCRRSRAGGRRPRACRAPARAW